MAPAGPLLGPASKAAPAKVVPSKVAPSKSPAGNACKTGNSFTPDTPVLLADGSSRPIAAIKVGDLVLATDPETGETGARPVTALIVGEGNKQLGDITIDTDGAAGEATGAITATDGHPFWVQAEHRWVDAKNLRPGAWLRTAAGTYVQITAIRAHTAHQRVHNLTVDGVHTYYVTAGASEVLVHNSSCGSNAKILGDNMAAAGVSRPAGTAAHHIVASTSKKAAPARAQLRRHGIDINDPGNGVFLPGRSASPNPTGASVHSRIHTNDYYNHVNWLMSGTRNASEARDVLSYMRRSLQGGHWP